MSARCVVRSLVVVVLATAATTVLAQPAEKKPPRKIERKPAVPADKPGASDPAPGLVRRQALVRAAPARGFP